MPPAHRVYLLRHATAERGAGQSEHHMFSTEDTRLSALGRTEAQGAAEALARFPIEHVVASHAARARHTAEIVAEPHGLDVATDEDLIEVAFAPYGTDYDEILERIVTFPQRFDADDDPEFPNGERYSDVVARLTGALERARGHGDEVAVVAHGISNRLLLGHLLGADPRRFLRLDQDHACVNVIEYVAERPMVRVVNWRPDLPGVLGSGGL